MSRWWQAAPTLVAVDAPWQAPDSRPEGASASPVPARSAPGDEPEPREVPKPIAVRPMTVIDVLDGGIMIIKSAPRTVFVVAATFVIPIQLIAAWVNRDALSERGISGLVETLSSTDTSDSSLTAEAFITL